MRVELTRLWPFEGRDRLWVCFSASSLFSTLDRRVALRHQQSWDKFSLVNFQKLGAASSHDWWETIKVDGHCYLLLCVSVCVTVERNQVVTVITGELMVITSKENLDGELAVVGSKELYAPPSSLLDDTRRFSEQERFSFESQFTTHWFSSHVGYLQSLREHSGFHLNEPMIKGAGIARLSTKSTLTRVQASLPSMKN